MKAWFIIISVAVISQSAFCGNFPKEFQNAARSYKRGKYAAAEKKFVKLYGYKVRQYGKDECMAYAALCAGARDDYAKAGEYVDKVKNKYRKTLCRMELLQRQRKWSEIIQLCKKDNFESWPERLIFAAAFIRGRAYAGSENAQAAEKDFILAKKNTLSKRNLVYADLCLGNLYRRQLKDQAKALAAFKAAAGTGPLNNAVEYNAALTCALLLSKQGNENEALKMLGRFKTNKIKSAYWKCRIFIAYGDVYAGSGNKAEALRNYKLAMETPKAPTAMVGTAKKKIATLEK